MRIRSSLEIDQMKKYSGDLSASSIQARDEARKFLDSAMHLLSRTPCTRRDLKDALKYARQAVWSLKDAVKDSGRSERVERKALRYEKSAKKALLREERLQIAQMKKAETEKETVVKSEEIHAEAEPVETKTGKAEEPVEVEVNKNPIPENRNIIDVTPVEE